MIRMYSSSDYPMLAQWWVTHGWNPVPEPILPKLGIVYEDDDNQEPIAACWLYMDNSVGVSMLEWLVTRPGLPGMQVIRSIKHMTKFMELEAKRMNYSVMLTTCKQHSLARLHEKNGFTKTDETMIHLIKFWQSEDE